MVHYVRIGIAFGVLMGSGLLATVALAANPSKNITPEKRLSIAFINDVHGQLEPHPELFWSGDTDERVHGAGGMSRIATAFKRLEAERPHGIIRIDGGDTFQGSAPAAWTEGGVMIRPMNALGIDVAIPGNWAVAYGAKRFQELAAQLNYPLLSANMVDEATGALLFEPYLLREINGLRVAFIGFTDEDVPTRQPPFMSDGLIFRKTEVLQPLIDTVRREEAADIVVLITHVGLPKSIVLAEELDGVDVLLSSDTHERTYEPILRGDTLIVEAGAFGSFVGVVDLVYQAGAVVQRDWELIELRAEHYPEDPKMKALVAEVLEPHRERMERPIGHSDIWLKRYSVMSTSMDIVIADALRGAAGTDIALSNGYRFSPPTPPGPITEGDLWNWLPIQEDLKAGEVDGREIIAYWEREFEQVFSSDPSALFGGWLPRPSTNMVVDFDSTAAAGERLRRLEIDGVPVEAGQTYTLASGAREGAPGDYVHRVHQCRMVYTLDSTTHDAVRRYLAESGPITASDHQPVRCVIHPGTLRSQVIPPQGESNEKNS